MTSQYKSYEPVYTNHLSNKSKPGSSMLVIQDIEDITLVSMTDDVYDTSA